jgi:hypothetical protein
MTTTMTASKKEGTMAHDFNFNFGSFASTDITVEALSTAARALLAAMFGAGAVSVTLPKSKGDDLARFFTQKGLTY